MNTRRSENGSQLQSQPQSQSQPLSLPSSHSSVSTTAAEEVNVLVTGFGPFASSPNNASWLVAKALPPTLRVSEAHPSRIRIIVYPEPIPVQYAAIHKILPDIYKHSPSFNIVLHLGVTTQRDHYSIERIASREGYTLTDVTGNLDGEPYYWQECPSRLYSSIRVEDVIKRWQSQASAYDCRVSDDAGRYLCEYLLYASLAYFHHEGNYRLPWQRRTGVTFMHLPNKSDQASIQAGRDVAIDLIYALVDSKRSRDGNDETENN